MAFSRRLACDLSEPCKDEFGNSRDEGQNYPIRTESRHITTNCARDVVEARNLVPYNPTARCGRGLTWAFWNEFPRGTCIGLSEIATEVAP